MNLKKRLILEAEKKNVMEKTVQFNPKKKKKKKKPEVVLKNYHKFC